MQITNIPEHFGLRNMYNTLSNFDVDRFFYPFFNLIEIPFRILLKGSNYLLNSNQSLNPQLLYSKHITTSKIILGNYGSLTEAQQISNQLHIPLLTIMINNSKSQRDPPVCEEQNKNKLEELLIHPTISNYLNNYFIIWLGVDSAQSKSINLRFYRHHQLYESITIQDFMKTTDPIEELQSIRDQFYNFVQGEQIRPDSTLFIQEQEADEQNAEEGEDGKKDESEEEGTVNFFNLDQICRFLKGFEQDDDEPLTEEDSDTEQ